MRVARKFLSLMAIAFAVSLTMVGCDDDDDNDDGPKLTGQSKTYVLSAMSDPTISGTIKFAERSDNATVVTIALNGTTSGNSHPAHIHANSAVETGDIVIDLNPVDGATGKSETVITKKNDGTSISYSDLLDFDGYANVHKSTTEMGVLVAQGDIGENELTSVKQSYNLTSVNASGVTGTVTFTKRANGTTLAVVDLDGALPTGEYPVYIYDNDIVTTGPTAITLTSVMGSSGVSYTNVTELDNGTAITYDQLVDFDGHIFVSASPANLDLYIAETNIGANN